MVLLTALPTSEIISALLLGGILGLVGQGIRAIMGVKKMREENANPALPSYDLNVSRLVASLFIGFAAGLLATLPFFKTDFSEGPKWSQQVILTLIAAGYSGADFIEGFLKNFLSEKPSSLPVAADIPKKQPVDGTSDDSMSISPNDTVAG